MLECQESSHARHYFVYFPLGFTNGSGFNGPLLARNYASLVRGEASLVMANHAARRSRGVYEA